MNSTQMRMARAALGWSSHELADRAHVGRVTIARFESGQVIAADTRAKIEKALSEAGASFIDRSGRIGVTIPK